MSKTSRTPLDVSKATPFPQDYFIFRVLVPEFSSLLISKYLSLPSQDPEVKETLGTSRVFGNHVYAIDNYPIDNEWQATKSSSLVYEKSSLALPQERLILRQLPTFMVPYINSCKPGPSVRGLRSLE